MLEDASDLDQIVDEQGRNPLTITILFLTGGLMMMEGYDLQLAGYAAPAMISDLQVSRVAFSSVFSVMVIGYMVGAFGLGMLSDKKGRKPTILLGALLFGTATLVTALSRDLTTIVTLRFIAGIGLGSAIPATIAINVEFAPSLRQARTVSLLFIAYNIGGGLGGIVAARLLPLGGWPSLFVVGGLLPIAIAGAIWAFVPESPRFLALQPRRAEELVSVVRRLRPELIVAPGRITALEISSPGVPVRHLFDQGRHILTIVLWMCSVLNFMTIYFLTSWLPTVLAQMSGLSQSNSALIGSALLFGGVVGSVVVGFLLDRRGAIAVTTLLLLSVPAIAAIGVLDFDPLLLTASVFTAGCLLLGGQTGVNAMAGTFYPTSIRSTGAGWQLGVGRLGAIIGPFVGGLLLTFSMSVPWLFVIAALPVLCGAVCTVLLASGVRPSRPKIASTVAGSTGHSRQTMKN